MSILHQLALTFIKNIGPATARLLLTHVEDAETIFNTNKAKFIKVPGIGEKTINQLDFDEGLRKAETELKNIEKNNIDVIFYTDTRFPPG
jgi:DNA processing protein